MPKKPLPDRTLAIFELANAFSILAKTVSLYLSGTEYGLGAEAIVNLRDNFTTLAKAYPHRVEAAASNLGCITLLPSIVGKPFEEASQIFKDKANLDVTLQAIFDLSNSPQVNIDPSYVLQSTDIDVILSNLATKNQFSHTVFIFNDFN